MAINNPKPMHPGRVLAAVFMVDHGLNQSQLAERLGCAPGKINEIVNGRRGVTADFALQLEAVFNLNAAAWVRMQGEYDVWVARQSSPPPKKPAKKKRATGSPRGGSSGGGSSNPVAARGYGHE